MRQAGIIAAACVYALEHNVERLAEDHRNARLLAERLTAIPGLRLESPRVETNIVMLDVSETGRSPEAIARELQESHAVRVSVYGEHTLRAVTHLDVSSADVQQAADAFAEVLGSRPSS